MSTSTDLKNFIIAKGTKAQITQAYSDGIIGDTDFAIATDEVYADTDLTNLSNAGKIAIAHNSMPSGTYDDLTLGASGTEYTAPADGYYFVNKTSNTSGQFLVIENQTTKMGSELIAVDAYNGLCVWQPVRKGEKVKINYNLGGATSFFRFVYAVGSESEA